MQQRQRDAEADALFDRQENDPCGRHQDQQKLAERLAADSGDLAEANDAKRDE